MLDISFIRSSSDLVKRAVADKALDLDVDRLLELDDKRRELIQKVDELRQQRNQAAKNRDMEKGKALKSELDSWETKLKETEDKLEHMMLYVPNIPSPKTPVGSSSDANIELKKWGELPKFDFDPKSHIELGRSLGIIDLEAGTKVAGFRGYYLKSEGAVLHRAVLDFALDKIMQAGFNLMVPPTLVHEKVLIGSGHFPFGKENIYQIANPGKLENGEEIKHPLFLTGTSEPSLLAYFMDQTLKEEDLPIKVCAMTNCYRSEVGDYGRDTKGLYRIHEFAKVEQVVITRADLEESESLFNRMQEISEAVLQELEIPYRVIELSTGDMGAGKFRACDIEAWMPGRGKYGETHSNSNLTDWQSRRLNMRARTKDGQLYYPHTLNNTAIASPRILIAILENFQQADGSVIVPEVLRAYTNFSKISPKS